MSCKNLLFFLTMQSYDDFHNDATFLKYFTQNKHILLICINCCVRKHQYFSTCLHFTTIIAYGSYIL